MIEQLLLHGADVLARDGTGAGALHVAAALGHADALRALLQGGADVDSITNNWYCSLSLGPLCSVSLSLVSSLAQVDRIACGGLPRPCRGS
jgi:hypothetical protein